MTYGLKGRTMAEIKVTDEARYQAARSLFVRDSPDRAWGDASQPTRVAYERRAETALAAAVPHLQVQAGGDGGLREALTELAKDRDSVRGAVPSDYFITPYEILELLRTHPAAPAVPQPVEREALTLGQIASALASCGSQQQIDEWPEQYRMRQAAAVLALLSPEQAIGGQIVSGIKITDEAVEACARAYYENLGWDWASLDTEAREHGESKAIILAEFRRSLEAATPLLQVQAIDRAAMIEAIESASYRTEDIRGEAYVENYAHAFADVVLALLSPEETK